MERSIEIQDEVKLAKFVAQLVREGVTFKVITKDESYFVELTGGF